MNVDAFDVVVLGAGMAGMSAAARLAADGALVAVVEPEAQPGVHATGRSVAVFTENYGNPTVRLLTVASRPFFDRPPAGFTDVPLLHRRGALWVGRPDQATRLDELANSGRALVPDIVRVDTRFALHCCPALAPGYVAGGVWEPGAADINVDALLHGYRRRLRAAGGRLLTGLRVQSAHRASRFRLSTSGGMLEAPVVVNAAGAWADQVAALFGARPLGLRPLRRTAFVFDPPGGGDPSGWPHVIDADETFYFKPESGRLIGSPADETPSEPVDARPDELDVAVALERIGAAMGTELRHAYRPWAGLRTFAADRTPVAGADPEVEGLVWLAGQGGYGIQTAPALAEAAASLVQTGALPAALIAAGLTEGELSPARFGRARD
ncbi:MAG: FAD-binding oxidoreductase [Acidimicrobiaceae bacterium]|nr:FAD-binding oxidoreductase [Acidimicrobiaceae bacterium]